MISFKHNNILTQTYLYIYIILKPIDFYIDFHTDLRLTYGHMVIRLKHVRISIGT